MKPLYSALVLIVCLALAGNAPAEARPASHSGTSKSYKSGFSSQKSNATRSQPPAPPANRQSGPGAFGQAAGSPASAQPQRNTSAMSRDVDQSAARANALKNLDARRNAGAAPPPLPPLNDTLQRPQQAPSYAGRSAGQPAGQPYYQPPPVYQPQPSNGLMHGLLGFMLGRAMSQSNQPVAYPTVNGGQPGVQGAGQPAAPAGTAAAGPEGAGMAAGMPGLDAPVAAPAPQPSFGASVLRWFLWLSVVSLMAWAVVYSVRKLRRLRTGSATHYSFERN
jgi:hypothetical protein